MAIAIQYEEFFIIIATNPLFLIYQTTKKFKKKKEGQKVKLTALKFIEL